MCFVRGSSSQLPSQLASLSPCLTCPYGYFVIHCFVLTVPIAIKSSARAINDVIIVTTRTTEGVRNYCLLARPSAKPRTNCIICSCNNVFFVYGIHIQNKPKWLLDLIIPQFHFSPKHSKNYFSLKLHEPYFYPELREKIPYLATLARGATFTSARLVVLVPGDQHFVRI